LVSLAPADLKKEGSIYDLPIALGYLLAEKEISFNPKEKLIFGELALDGKLRPIKGAICFSILAKEKGFSEIILPKENAKEAGLIEGIKVIGVSSLKEAIEYLEKRKRIEPEKVKIENLKENYQIDFAFIKGQKFAKRALEISAAGGHNVLMIGPPGTGKTLLAKAIPTILPPLSFEESLEVTKIYSIAGILPKENPLITKRPFRAPHHTTSEVALIGGGNPPRPGEITLAHRGVLFLDEFPEYHRDVLESLRQPIEEGKILILRAKHSVELPARFILVAASNPCPCGYYGNEEKECKCTISQIRNYQRKLSGPLVDRMDLLIHVPNVKYEKLVGPDEETSEKIKERVIFAREIQKERFKKDKTNSEMEISEIEKYCQIDSQSENLLRKYVDSGKLSVRGYHRVLKVARTIADLEGKEKISFEHLSEALSYRIKEGEI
jgi:magnesium chelatase family protein